ncbi:hypothetical protein BH10ACT7_BH10ACT7_11660 [soil metagenome]
MATTRAVSGFSFIHHGGRGAAVLRALIVVLAVVGLVAQPLAASAAGTAVITVSATPVNYLDGSPAPTAGMGINGNRLAYQVSYSCSVSDCDGATVKVAPTQLDPNYGFYRLLNYQSWTAPASGGTISGNATAGLTVNLGNLPVGASGTFTIVFTWAATGSYTMNERADVAASNFPNDTPITLGLTADATTAVAPFPMTSAASLWKTTTPEPGVVAATAVSVLADTNYTYELRMGSGCMSYIESASKGDARYLCAADYTLVHTLPAGAELVSISGDSNPTAYNRTYDPVANTITWEAPPWATSGVTPAVGWNTVNNWTGKKPRYITVKFPSSAFAPAGATCDYTTPTTITSNLSVTYISLPGEPGVVKPATDVRSINVYCVTPFPKAFFDAKTSTFDGTARENANTSVVVIPVGPAVNEKYWQTVASNQSNVAGVAVTTDNTLDQAGAPVYQISAFTNSTSATAFVADLDAVVDWEATDGTTTQTGSTIGVANIETLIGTGWRFTKAVVTSGSLAGPNTVATGNARTNSIVQFAYRVAPTAIPGALRTNTASAVMTYPNTALADVDLGSKAHSIRFTAPNARAAFIVKDSTNDGVSGETRLVNVPATGSVNRQWGVQVSNRGNVPGVAVITDNQLAQPGTQVYQIYAAPLAGASATYELDNGTTGTAATLPYNAPAGRYIVKATVTSGPISGPNALPTQNAESNFLAYFPYRVLSTAPIGEYRTNTATAVMNYPDYPSLSQIDLGSLSRTIRFSTTKAVFSAQFPIAAAIAGGGSTATPATDVTFSVRGGTSSVYPTVNLTPQYVFIAPAGWEITPGSATFATLPAPGVTYAYRTVTIAGVPRQAVVATWPNTEHFGENAWWNTMTVVARPGSAVAAGTVSNALAYMGDSRHTYAGAEATYGNAFQDAPDLDGDGVTTEWFAGVSQNVTVGAAGAMKVIKEICSPNPSASDGCTWISDSTTVVGVAPNSTSIKYRLTVVNSGNTTLSNAVGYDVLPYIGDTGTSDATAGSPRNSDFTETVNAVSALTSGVVATYSMSTNPPRPEVYSGVTTGTWTGAASGASAIRMAFAGNLAPGASASMVYTANVVGSPVDGDQACNSFAVKITGIGTVSEPAAVCAAIQEADLAISVPAHLPLQQGRPGVLPFTVQNNGGSPAASAQVTLTIPTGVSLRSLTPSGWTCVATPGGATAGPLSLTCDPVDGTGLPRTLPMGVPETINLAVTTTAVATQYCVAGTIDGPTYDGTPGNDTASACAQSFSSTAPFIVTKDDSRATVAVGDEYTYTVIVANGLVGEAIPAATLVDTLPAGVQFVSAGDGGTETSAGVVTWPAFALAAAGSLSANGNSGSGASGSTFTTTVTVRVLPAAVGSVTNTATATAPDPLDAGVTLTGTASDTDTLRKLAITKTSTSTSIGVLAGETVTYTVTVTNTGTAAYTVGSPAAIQDELAAVTDDATFVGGSASISVNGGAGQAVVPVGGVLTWSGALPVGQSAVLTYQVLVGDGSTGDRVLTNSAYSSAAGTGCDPTTGVDTTGFSCVVTTTPFAPTFAKTISSYEQLANGTWRIVYALDVVNLNAAAAVTYSISDSLAFGAGIPVASAQITTAPAGVTPVAWAGTGAVVSSVVLPAAAIHHYELTVVTGAFVPGTSAACVTGSSGGFANSATFAPLGGTNRTATVCAQPTRPTITKSVATPTQNADGTWDVVYTVTVTAPSGSPASGLAYTVGDTFGFPAGVTVNAVAVTGPAGAPINSAFTGTSQTQLLTGADRVSTGSPRVFIVTARTSVPAGAVTGADLACAPAGTAGYANAAVLYAGNGSTVLGQAPACAAVTAQPTPVIAKRVTSSVIDGVTGEWTIGYEITVTNPSATLVTTYDLDDELQFGTGITVIGSPTIASADATVDIAWDGDVNTAIVADESLAAGAVHTYTVTVVANTVTVTDANVSQMDCVLDSGETGTGFRNVASLSSGVAPQTFATACEAANDPSVVKTTVGSPVQDSATGVWTIVYEITGTNRATTSPVGGYPYTLTDTFDFPAGTTLVGPVEVTGPGTATITPTFDGTTQTTLASASIGAAVDDLTPAQQVYTVTAHFTAAGGLAPSAQFCDPTQGPGGLRNQVEVSVGARVTGDVACADAPDVPTAGIGKALLSQEQQADGTWLVLYRITVANPDPSITTVYDLEDQFQLGAGISLDSTPTVVANPPGATINPSWNGASNSTVTEQMVLPGGATHTYTVRAVIDAGSVRATDAAGDCVLDTATESGTGFTNSATALTGAVERTQSACVTAFDPSVTKTIAGEPVRNLDGSFTIDYVITVQNPTADVDLTYELTDALAFPTATVFDSVDVAGRAGSPTASSTWNGVADQVVVAAGTGLAGGAIHVFDVRVTATLPPGQGSLVNGWANTAEVSSSTGGAVTSDSTVYADIEVPELAITKTSDAPAVVRIGDTINYTITAENVGVGDFTASFPAEVWDYLEDVIDDASFGGAATATPGIGFFAYEADRFSWISPLASGDSVDITYSVIVTGAGNQNLRNVALAPDLPGTDPDEPTTCSPDGCAELSTPLPGFLLEKTVSAGVVTAGDAVTYTITYTNTGTVDVTGATFTDDLSAVHDDAVSAVPSATTGTATLAGDDLTWVGDLAAGQSVTVTYTVTVTSPLTGDGLLDNTATADPDFATRWPGGTCPTGPAPCAAPDRDVTVSTAVRALAFTKSVDVAHATVGQKVTYTVALTNIGVADYTSLDPAVVADNLTGVLDDATYNGDASATSGNLAYLAPNLGWSGPLAAGNTVVVRFSVTVKPQLGDAKLLNTVGLTVGSVAAAQCLAAPVDNAAAACFTSTTIAPLASTGSPFGIAPLLIAILLFLVGFVFFLLHVRRTRREQQSHP